MHKEIDNSLGNEHGLGRDDRVKMSDHSSQVVQHDIENFAIIRHDKNSFGAGDDQRHAHHVFCAGFKAFRHLGQRQFPQQSRHNAQPQEQRGDLIDVPLVFQYAINQNNHCCGKCRENQFMITCD